MHKYIKMKFCIHNFAVLCSFAIKTYVYIGVRFDYSQINKEGKYVRQGEAGTT